jgi:hypothetical protein
MKQDHDTGTGSRTGISGLLALAREYLGIGGKVRREPIRDPAALRAFVSSRASFIAQTSLYGYFRTRAGQRYPELFENDSFVDLLNSAKWHVWLACVSDLAVYSGGLLARGGMPSERVGSLMRRLLDEILDETGMPAEADAGFPEHAQRVRARIALTPWESVTDDEGCFHESPTALVKHAPIVESLMRLDEEVVRNSVRFRWQEVRRDMRELLDVDAVSQSSEA